MYERARHRVRRPRTLTRAERAYFGAFLAEQVARRTDVLRVEALREVRSRALYLASAQLRTLTPAEAGTLETVGAALGSELARRQEEAQLQEGIDAREAALAVVVHDLRNPLNAISVGAGMLLPRITEPSLRRPVERIQRSAQRMERLFQDLLDIHAIEGGRFTVSKGEVAPTSLILTALESQQSLAGQTSVIINTDVAPALASPI